MKEVVIIQRRLTDYRVPLFEGLRQTLLSKKINLRLLNGVGTERERAKGDSGSISWAEPLPTTYFLQDRICWQSFREVTRVSDLVIITQENWMIANHLALIAPRQGRLAFWGHGGNFQRQKRDWRDRYKDWSSRQVDWWFGYTSLSQGRVEEAGFPPEKITCLNNAVDTSSIALDLAKARETRRAEILANFNLQEGNFGIFIGSLYREKRVDFLIDAAMLIKQAVPDFQLLIVGNGPDEMSLKSEAEALDWVHFVGGRRGSEKAQLLRLAKVFLNPGLVGLGIFDALCAGIPLLTTDCGLHSPEIAYLEADVGVMTSDDITVFAETAIKTLIDPVLRDSAARKGPELANRLGLDQMIVNFAAGIQRALEL
jgi:glycosyltransferase involved in cell wall biosynthesis